MYLIFPWSARLRKNAKWFQLRLLIGKTNKKDSQLFGSLLCSCCLGSSRKKQRLKRKLAFWVCSQAFYTTSSTAIFSTAVGILVLMMLCKLGHVSWFGRNALVTRVVCFSRLSKETRHCFEKRFLFYIDDENNVAISETRQYFVLVPSGYSFAISGSIWLS